MAPSCPLCHATTVRDVACVDGRDYFACSVCALTFMAPRHHLEPELERARYLQHRNHPGDAGYRAFLDRLCAPLAARLPAGAHGLDYGCGPGPTLSVMMEERGFRMTNYDPFFAPDDAALARSYDFATCTETAEHFARPFDEFARLGGLLRKGGWLGVMTEMRNDRPFETWWYVRDPTHVCFYRAETMDWIAERFGWGVERGGRNVTLFRT